MRTAERLLADIHTLKEAINIDWEELHSNPLREGERREIRKHIDTCQSELKGSSGNNRSA